MASYGPFNSASIGELQRLLDTFVEIYNHHPPHQSLAGRAVPGVAFQARPETATARTQVRVRTVSDVPELHLVAGAGFEPATFGL
jgi:hypothetical protein